MSLSPLVDVGAVAARLGANERRVYQLAREGLLDGCVVRLGRRIKFDADGLERLLARGGRAFEYGWRRHEPVAKPEP